MQNFQRILTDVDGVLLEWESAFHAWMKEKGYNQLEDPEVSYHLDSYYNLDSLRVKELISQFNESAWIGYLKPLRDSVNVVQEIYIEHHHFEAITSLSLDHWAGELRRRNLERWFGPAVRRCRCIGTGADKDDILKEYEPSWWIEDKPENCDAGLKAGHRPILMDHEHNRWYSNPNVIRVKNWKEIKEIVL